MHEGLTDDRFYELLDLLHNEMALRAMAREAATAEELHAYLCRTADLIERTQERYRHPGFAEYLWDFERTDRYHKLMEQQDQEAKA